jgi:hypothetical protein
MLQSKKRVDKPAAAPASAKPPPWEITKDRGLHLFQTIDELHDRDGNSRGTGTMSGRQCVAIHWLLREREANNNRTMARANDQRRCFVGGGVGVLVN